MEMGERSFGGGRRRHGDLLFGSPVRGIPYLSLLVLLLLACLSGCGNAEQEHPRFSDDVVERLDEAVADQMEYNEPPRAAGGRRPRVSPMTSWSGWTKRSRTRWNATACPGRWSACGCPAKASTWSPGA